MTFQLYFILSTDFKAHIYNESLILVCQMPMHSRLFQHCQFVDSSDVLIAGGVEGIFYYKLGYTGANDKKQVHKLDPLGLRLNFQLKLVLRLDGVTEWTKGFKVDEEHDIIFAWSLKQTSVYQLSNG